MQKRRGSSDRLSTEGVDLFTQDLSKYIMNQQQTNIKLWRFGAYGDDKPDGHAFAVTCSKSPVIADLLVNFELWTVILKHMLLAKMS